MLRHVDVLLIGLAITVLDFRIDGFDVLPDPIGYGVAAWGVLLARRHGFPSGWATVAAAGFAVTALFSVVDVVDPGRPTQGLQVESWSFDLFNTLRGIAQDAALGATMMALSLAAAARGAERLALHARRTALAFAALLAAGLLLDVATLFAGPEDTWPLLLALLLVGVVAFVVAVVLLWRARDLPQPPEAAPAAVGEAI